MSLSPPTWSWDGTPGARAGQTLLEEEHRLEQREGEGEEERGREGSSCSAPAGRLTVHVGDALGEDARLEGGFAALFVDLFAKEGVIPELQRVAVWRSLRGRLRAGGRCMVNAGGGCVATLAEVQGRSAKGGVGEARLRAVLLALEEAFAGEVQCFRLGGRHGNVVALTGPPIDIGAWRGEVPPYLHRYLEEEPVGIRQFLDSQEGDSEA
eukprot:TRINITY_DN2966_c0_g1_i5.p4 TRINITY_DN2966_c0_g1~~TRINITY_DN2966_c0_g1_i5.p4  ORF type:complete len:210 (+),score=61.48 TRINITY_DN2966_c0_g1_i5:1073-1702(+)